MARRVLIACDKFKGSLTATEVVDTIERALTAAVPDVRVSSLLVADGGDGTLDAAVRAGYERVPLTVAGPTGEPNPTSYAVKDGTAVVEMADACGIVKLPGGRREPLTATSRGVGEVLRAVLDRADVSRIYLGIGGSASTDGGAGMLQALGARICDVAGQQLPDGGGPLADVATVDFSGLHPRLRDVEVIVACDVNNPLLGDMGAPAIFAPQKGASADEVALLDANLARFAALVTAAVGRDDTSRPGAGAAGGVGYAAQAVLDARMVPGVEFVLGLADFAEQVKGASLVVTGEGSIDRQTLLGKTPAGVADAARAAGVRTVAVCGRNQLEAGDVEDSGIERVYALTDLEPDPEICMAQAGPLLAQLVTRVAADWLTA